MSNHKVLIALSGGMDSATMLGMAIANGLNPATVGFVYGSKHNSYEQAAAEKLVAHYGVPYDLIDLSAAMSGIQSNLLKSGGDIPEGHYEAPEMSQTVVPGRNMIFASILAGIAWSRKIPVIWLGVHRGDHAIYPDCRAEFVHWLQGTIYRGTGEKVSLATPFLLGDKIAILKMGLELRVPYELTRSCYKDQELSCGKCGACQERLEAFAKCGAVDPISYES